MLIAELMLYCMWINFLCVYSDIKIATAQSPKDISELAAEIGLLPHEFDLYGKKKAKVSLKVLDRLSHQQNGNYVIVTGLVLPVDLFVSYRISFHVSGSVCWVTQSKSFWA